MSLKEYKKKRDFTKTPEPEGNLKSTREENIYSIQEHHASHLHWDLRIEKDGVLKSWAIPKQPVADPNVKRLAIQTEDHPLDYAFFEGVIPEGQYGAGTVKLWDKGTQKILEYEPDKKYVIQINGKKLKGVFVLLRIKNNQWLFFKKKHQSNH